MQAEHPTTAQWVGLESWSHGGGDGAWMEGWAENGERSRVPITPLSLHVSSPPFLPWLSFLASSLCLSPSFSLLFLLLNIISKYWTSVAYFVLWKLASTLKINVLSWQDERVGKHVLMHSYMNKWQLRDHSLQSDQGFFLFARGLGGHHIRLNTEKFRAKAGEIGWGWWENGPGVHWDLRERWAEPLSNDSPCMQNGFLAG